MPYSYEKERDSLFTDEGQRMFLKIRDHVSDILNRSGAVQLEKAIDCVSGDSWMMLACIDRMVELGELKEVASGIYIRK